MSGVDELVESMTSGVFVSGDKFSVTASGGHPHFFARYKNHGVLAERQAKRRQEFLELQTKKRFAAVALFRHLEGVDDEQEETEDIDVDVDNEEVQSTATEPVGQRKWRRTSPFLNQLMCSEWLVHVPEDLADEWIMVPCPEGKRVLVSATNGITRAYAKSGYMLKEFHSELPGDMIRNTKSTVLDCVLYESSKTFYCLDVICWNGHPVFDSDTEFRFFWLQSKLDEVPASTEQTDTNRYIFKNLRRCSCQPKDMEAMMESQFPFKLDGLLFYHKRAHYIAGQTPLVGWLKPFMLPRILGVNIPSQFTAGNEQTRATDFMKHFDDDYEKKHSGRQYGGKMKNEFDSTVEKKNDNTVEEK